MFFNILDQQKNKPTLEIFSEQDLKDSNTHVAKIALYKIEKPFQHIHTVI